MAASLRGTLLALLLAGSLVPLAGLGWLEYRNVAESEVEHRRDEFRSEALAAALRADAAAVQGSDPLAAASQGVTAEDVLLMGPDGNATRLSGPAPPWPEVRAAAGDTLSGVQEVERPDEGLKLVAWARAPTTNGMIVLVRPPLSTLAPTPALPFILLAAFVALGVAIVLGFVVLRVVAPVGRLEAAALRLARGDAPAPVVVEGPSEVRSLASAFNTMAEELAHRRAEVERLLEERTRALIDREEDLGSLRFTLAHEFREPIRSMLWMADDLLERPLDRDAREATLVLRRRIEDLDAVFRDLLRYEDVSRRPAPIDDVPLESVLRNAISEAHQAGPLRVESERLPVVRGNRDLLTIALAELLRNAAQHGRRGPESAVARVTAERDGDDVVLNVDDLGPGIPVQRREDAVQLFQRMRRQAPGTGAGLAIARRAIQRHDGDLTLAESPGGGTRVTVRLPSGGPAPRSPLPEEPAGRRF